MATENLDHRPWFLQAEPIVGAAVRTDPPAALNDAKPEPIAVIPVPPPPT